MIHTRTICLSAAAGILLSVLTGCRKESGESPAQETVLPVQLERFTPDTRVDIADGNGICSWTEGDAVGLYATGETFSGYKTSVVMNGSVRINLAADQHRADFAVYPLYAAVPDHHSAGDFQVVYPDSYVCARFDADGLAVWSPAPMVAENTGEELLFRHVGALLRLRISNISPGTTSLAVSFEGMTDITGTYSVSDPGTVSAATTLVSGTGNTVTYTNLPEAVNGGLTLNVPLPEGDYSGLSAIRIAASGGREESAVVRPVAGWGQITRAQGKQYTVDFVSIYYRPAYEGDGRFGDYCISKGILKWEAGQEAYILTDGDDPLEILDYFGDNGQLNVIYHQLTGSESSVKYRLGKDNNNGEDVQYPVRIGDQTWLIPSVSEWLGLFAARTGDKMPSVNGVALTTAAVVVALDGSGSHAGKGRTNSSGSIQNAGGTDFHYGFIAFPNGAVVSCPSIQSGFITEATLRVLVEGGCVFFPITGWYYPIQGGWGCTATTTGRLPYYYWLRSNVKSTAQDYWYNIGLTTGNNTPNYLFGNVFLPIKLIHE